MVIFAAIFSKKAIFEKINYGCPKTQHSWRSCVFLPPHKKFHILCCFHSQAELIITFPLASENDGLGAGVTNSVHAQAHSHTSHKLLGGEKIAGSAMNRLGASEANPKGAYQG